eukprot:SAG31_NODE_7153_length_1772_cov_1.913329_3_plen_216_part_01
MRSAVRQPGASLLARAAIKGRMQRCQRHGAAAVDVSAVAEFQPSRPVLAEQTKNFVCPAHMLAELNRLGSSFFAGVPDSLLSDFCAYLTVHSNPEQHVIAANEGTAIATAAGHHLATGKIPVVYLQNSGLGNCVNPLLSLCDPGVYSVPILLLIGWRGQPGKKDEPQHTIQGQRSKIMLESMGITVDELPDYDEGATQCLEHAYAQMKRTNAPYAV